MGDLLTREQASHGPDASAEDRARRAHDDRGLLLVGRMRERAVGSERSPLKTGPRGIDTPASERGHWSDVQQIRCTAECSERVSNVQADSPRSRQVIGLVLLRINDVAHDDRDVVAVRDVVDE